MLFKGSSPFKPITYEKQNEQIHYWFGVVAAVVMNAVVHAPRKAGAKVLDESG